MAVPYFNGRGFHLDCPLEELLEGYSGEAVTEQKSMELVILRDKMRRAEEADNQTANESISKR